MIIILTMNDDGTPRDESTIWRSNFFTVMSWFRSAFPFDPSMSLFRFKGSVWTCCGTTHRKKEIKHISSQIRRHCLVVCMSPNILFTLLNPIGLPSIRLTEHNHRLVRLLWFIIWMWKFETFRFFISLRHGWHALPPKPQRTIRLPSNELPEINNFQPQNEFFFILLLLCLYID